MNKGELIQALEAKFGSRKAAGEALEAVVDTIIREVAKSGKVAITGFGTFEKVDRAARTGRNPRTGEKVRIKKTSVPRFRAGTQFKDVTANPRKLPKVGAVGVRASASTASATAAPARTAAKKAAPAKAAVKASAAPAKAAAKAPATKAPAKAAPVAKAATAAKKAPAKAAAAAKKAPATKAAATKAPAKAAAKKAPARKK